MFGWGKNAPVAEHEADGEIERVYHQIRQTLRVTGVNLNFRTWAAESGVLPAIWDAMLPNAATDAFEHAADQIRTQAADAVISWSPLHARDQAHLGPSQDYQLRAALELYHYINPKLLVLTSATLIALRGEKLGRPDLANQVHTLPRGWPVKMYAMEMELDPPQDTTLQALFKDIQQTLDLKSINSDYRTLGLWPNYLAAAWERLRPRVAEDVYQQAAEALRHAAHRAARELPYPVPVLELLGHTRGDVKAATASAEKFEQILSGLILNIALFLRDWQDAETLRRSPFPVAELSKRGAQ